MRPVTQTKFGSPDGNCFAACVASILEVDLDSVPQDQSETWWHDFGRWLSREHRLVPVMIDGDGEKPVMEFSTGAPEVYWIASGMGPRGLLHSVVAKGSQLVHDPHPSGEFIKRVKDATLFVPLAHQVME